ncbi:MAG: NAD(P)H-hydrate epimerase [Pirellulales bacterium]|nr:NAD(P)H-hydrate epimerase [Pirellulales bacterium]
MEPLALSRRQSREADRLAIERYGFSGLVLMENAGRGCVDVLERLGIGGTVVIVCGKGNNAGDGFVMARHLAIRGYACNVLLASPPEELQGDAATNFAILRHCGIPIASVFERFAELPEPGATRRGGSFVPPTLDSSAAWIVDALLGTGALGEPRPPFDAVIDWINTHSLAARVLAVDLPSGLDCDTGQPALHTVRADHTCTFGAAKIGFQQPAAKRYLGIVHVCDIGLPQRLFEAARLS